MKKLIYTLLVLPLFTFWGCEKNLDPEIFGNVNTTVFPVTEDDYENYMMEAYKTFTSKWEYFPIEGSDIKYHMWFSLEESYFQLFDCCTDQMNVFTGWGSRFTIPSTANLDRKSTRLNS